MWTLHQPLTTTQCVCAGKTHTQATHFAGRAHIFTQHPAAQERQLRQEHVASADKERVTPALIQHQSPFIGLIYFPPRVLTHFGVIGQP